MKEIIPGSISRHKFHSVLTFFWLDIKWLDGTLDYEV